jgi:hypothetical protein
LVPPPAAADFGLSRCLDQKGRVERATCGTITHVSFEFIQIRVDQIIMPRMWHRRSYLQHLRLSHYLQPSGTPALLCERLLCSVNTVAHFQMFKPTDGAGGAGEGRAFKGCRRLLLWGGALAGAARPGLLPTSSMSQAQLHHKHSTLNFSFRSDEKSGAC